jgi:LacI family transcriptional regulator
MIKAAKEYLKQGSCDAIVATSYSCFIILKAAIMLDIKVPEALGVVSLDNEQYAPFLFPSLSTVDEPLFEIAKRAVNILFESMNGGKICKKLELSPFLSERESTGR